MKTREEPLSGPERRAAELGLELGELREAIRGEYQVVAAEPEREFHFHTGRHLAGILGLRRCLVDRRSGEFDRVVCRYREPVFPG